VALAIDKHVPGFQIAVDDAFLMRVLHRGADFDEQLQAGLGSWLGASHPIRQCFAVDELHRQERLLAGGGGVGACLQDLRDAGMLQAPQGFGLQFKAGARRGIAESRRQHLECHLPRRMLLLGPVDHAHAAAAEQAENAEAGDLLRQRGGGSERAAQREKVVLAQERRLGIEAQQLFDLRAQRLVGAALGAEELVVEELGALSTLQPTGGEEQALDELAAFGHRWRMVARSSLERIRSTLVTRRSRTRSPATPTAC
jgi:hypothetical protein